MNRSHAPLSQTEHRFGRPSDLFRSEARQSGLIGYLFASLAQAALVALLLLINPYLPLGRYPISYISLVMLSAYLFGEGPAILSLIIGWLAYDYFFLQPLHTLYP